LCILTNGKARKSRRSKLKQCKNRQNWLLFSHFYTDFSRKRDFHPTHHPPFSQKTLKTPKIESKIEAFSSVAEE